MARKPREDFQVLVPLSKLMSLIESAQRVDDLEYHVKRLSEQLTALRGQFLELMEEFGNIKD